MKSDINKKVAVTALFLGLLSIILGAFGAHALKKVLSQEQLISFETGVRYQMYQAVFLLFLAKNQLLDQQKLIWIFRMILIGVILFSGSIYLLTTKDITGIDISAVGFITPLGGLFMILGWGLTAFGLIYKK